MFSGQRIRQMREKEAMAKRTDAERAEAATRTRNDAYAERHRRRVERWMKELSTGKVEQTPVGAPRAAHDVRFRAERRKEHEVDRGRIRPHSGREMRRPSLFSTPAPPRQRDAYRTPQLTLAREDRPDRNLGGTSVLTSARTDYSSIGRDGSVHTRGNTWEEERQGSTFVRLDSGAIAREPTWRPDDKRRWSSTETFRTAVGNERTRSVDLALGYVNAQTPYVSPTAMFKRMRARDRSRELGPDFVPSVPTDRFVPKQHGAPGSRPVSARAAQPDEFATPARPSTARRSYYSSVRTIAATGSSKRTLPTSARRGRLFASTADKHETALRLLRERPVDHSAL